MEPLWNEEFEFQEWEDGAELDFLLYDKDLAGSDFLGKAILQYDRFQDGFNGDVQLEETDVNNEQHRAFLRIKIKPPGKEYPPGPAPEYWVNLEKGEHKSFELEVNAQDGKTLYISSIHEEGPAAIWNRQAEPSCQLVRGDFVVEANGIVGDAKAMQERFSVDDIVVMRVRRGIDIRIILERNTVTNEDGTEGGLEKFGIETPEQRLGDSLVVLALRERGLIPNWNASTGDPVSKVQVGDRILRVGNAKGSAMNIAKALKEASGKFQMHLVRAAPEQFDDEGRKQEGSSHWLFG